MSSSSGLGQAVRLVRQRRGLTQAQLAAEAHLSRVHLGRIELNQVEPTPRIYQQLVSALGFAYGFELIAASRRKHD